MQSEGTMKELPNRRKRLGFTQITSKL